MHSSLLQALLVVLGLAGCSSTAFRGHTRGGEDRLEVLTSFSLALSKHNFRDAAGYLPPADRAKLADPETGILPEYRDRIRAIRRTTLLNNPLIEVRHGLIYGIPDVLPVIALGQADTLDLGLGDTAALGDGPGSGLAASEDSGGREAAKEKAELKRASEEFFRAVAKGRWETALGYLHAGERGEFVDAKGKVKEEARRRLAGADTSEWEALTLRDGKLTGIVLIIPGKSGKRPFY
jgi:hypothetical protein